MVRETHFSGPITNAVVTAVADAKDVDPSELDLVLHEYIDVDALESLSTHEDSSWTLAFELPEHTVTVTNDGVILVDGSVQKVRD